MENYRLNTRVASSEREYLIQTSNDTRNGLVCSMLFSDGILLETVEEKVELSMPDADILELVKSTHVERKEEVERLFAKFEEALNMEDTEQIDYLGLALFYKRMYSEAEVLFRKAVLLDPEAHEPLNHLGLVLMLKENYQEAQQVFQQCVDLQPKFADYHNSLGESFLATGSCKRAMIEFDEATNINLYYGDAYLNKALTYMSNAVKREDFEMFSQHQEKTIEVLEKAVVICPELQDNYFLEGRKLLEQGDLQGAYSQFLKTREAKKERRYQEFSSIYVKLMIGSNQLDEKLLTKRIKTLKEEISKNPHYSDLHYDLAVAYTLLGRFIHSKAIYEYKQALKINPNYERAKKSLKLAENEFRGFDALIKAITRG